MQIIVYKLRAKSVIQSPNRKFALTKDPSGKQILQISEYENPPGHQHIELIPINHTLIGAGHIYYENNQYKVQWGSYSCREKFGYDRPENDDALLDEIRHSIINWDLENLMNNQ